MYKLKNCGNQTLSKNHLFWRKEASLKSKSKSELIFLRCQGAIAGTIYGHSVNEGDCDDTGNGDNYSD